MTSLQAAEDTLPPAHVKSGSATIDVTFGSGKIDLPEQKVLAWISTAAEAVASYFGHFPVTHARILVRPAQGRRGVFNGTTFGSTGRSTSAFTRISLGEHTTEQELDHDWMMTHELVHLAFPNVMGEDREHHWIEEGMATYIEPIARAQIGNLSADKVWLEMARYMPQGLPEAGDQGLDNTPTWGRTYWGGALFWLLADVKIHECTKNRKGLEDVMRAILNEGGNIEQDWPIKRVLHAGDKATGCHVLMELYNQMKDKPVETDLNDLWRRLGIVVKNGAVSYNDQAPLASVRKAIIQGNGSGSAGPVERVKENGQAHSGK